MGGTVKGDRRGTTGAPLGAVFFATGPVEGTGIPRAGEPSSAAWGRFSATSGGGVSSAGFGARTTTVMSIVAAAAAAKMDAGTNQRLRDGTETGADAGSGAGS